MILVVDRDLMLVLLAVVLFLILAFHSSPPEHSDKRFGPEAEKLYMKARKKRKSGLTIEEKLAGSLNEGPAGSLKTSCAYFSPLRS